MPPISCVFQIESFQFCCVKSLRNYIMGISNLNPIGFSNQQQRCREHYDYDRKNQIHCPSLCQKSTEFFCIFFFPFKNINLGAHFLLKAFFDNPYYHDARVKSKLKMNLKDFCYQAILSFRYLQIPILKWFDSEVKKSSL